MNFHKTYPLIILFLLFLTDGYSQNWTGNVNTDWNNSANWDAWPLNGQNLTIDPGNYTGAGASPIISVGFPSVFTPADIDVQTAAVLTIQDNLTMNGRFTVTDPSSIVNMSAGTLNINGPDDIRIERDGVFNLTGGIINVSGKMRIDRGGKFNMSGAATILNVTDVLEIRRPQTTYSSFNMSNGTTNITNDIELDGKGTSGTTPTLNISGGIFNANANLLWIDNNPTVEYPHLIVSGGTVTVAQDARRDASNTTKIDIDQSGGTLIFQGHLIMDNLLDRFDQTGGTVQFDNTKNWTNAGIYLATAGTAVFNGITTLLDATGSWQFYNLTINAGKTLNQSAPPNINVAGDWTNSGGTFIENAKKVTINGSAAQALTATGGENFYDLTINKSAGTLTLNNNVTASITAGGSMVMTKGNIDCLANTLTLGTSTTNVGTLTHTSGTIIGKFQRWLNATGAWLFPVGTATNYRSDSLVINTLTTNGNLTVEFLKTDPGLLPGCPGSCSLIDGPRTMKLSFSEGYWRQTVGGGLAASDYTMFLRGENFTSRFLGNLTRILKGTIGAWGLDGTHTDLVGVTAERDNIIGGLNDDFCLAETGVNPLPITLTSFTATPTYDAVQLNWITASEINNDFFTVERSTDAKHWEEIIITQGAGNSNQTLTYFEIDYSPLEGISYYRLKQTDFDGKFEYFNIVPVKFESNNEGTISIFPNPVHQGGNISVKHYFNSTDEILVVLRDLQGKEFYSKIHVNVTKNELIGIPIDYEIPTGIYIVVATSENKIYSKKILIK